MVGYYRNRDVVISAVENGFMIDVHGPRDMQEDGLLVGRYVFGGIDGLLDFLRDHLKTVGELGRND